ncbi:glycoside hydrolase family 3 N-terminal domain-containing protein [Stakelama sediminis]|uniref:beta-glucosidase n=1 Tax=Stakelama sediminis TaxID=463200 RepID=A0A840Z264_9SPHN|nr:glycoside hydrolase family 3 N-terminal domain-containing protein [Stakelama sediminis]MBB5720005.1 beta-glucosidase [Stakelama sediminis]
MLKKPVARRSIIQALGLMTAWSATPVRAALKSMDAKQTPAFIDKLIQRMTLEEKAGQLTIMAAAWGGSHATALNPPGDGKGFDDQLADAAAGRLTGVFNGGGAEMALRMQKAVMQKSRMKIPLLFAADVIHGFRTIFPIPLAEASSFDPDLAMRTARAAAFEASGAGIDWTFAPMVDIARDQRWGRVMEGAGEDVYLGDLFAAARTRGFQGESLNSDESCLACPKHFAAYGAVEAGLDYNHVDMSMRTLREVYLPPFKKAFEAGAMTTMASFNDINGVPSTENHWLLTELLRDEWGFTGMVVSDYTGDQELIAHGVAADGKDAARLAFLAGVDMSMQSDLYYKHLPDLVRGGAIPEEKVDMSVRRVLMIKAMLGLFDDPFLRIKPAREKSRAFLPANIALSREAARKSIVLLKNEGDLLPLSTSKKIAVIGPFADGKHDLIGGWVVYGTDQDAVDMPTALRAAGADFTVTKGSDVEKPLEGGIDAAVAAAQAADVVVLAIGESQNMSGEAQSRVDIVVPEPQQAVAEAVAKTGKPIVVLLKNGRGLALKGAVRDAAAILVTWQLGTQGSNAIADILFGAHGPSGRLPISLPYATGQEPYYYAHRSTGRPQPADQPREPYKAQYRTVPNAALYPFGHGLTYGNIAYSDLTMSSADLPWDGTIELGATITNSGKRAAEETAQLYIHDVVANVTRPVRLLTAFQKVQLAPGESKKVRFSITRQDLLYIGLDMKWGVEPGAFDVWIAPSAQAEGVKGSFTLQGG